MFPWGTTTLRRSSSTGTSTHIPLSYFQSTVISPHPTLSYRPDSYTFLYIRQIPPPLECSRSFLHTLFFLTKNIFVNFYQKNTWCLLDHDNLEGFTLTQPLSTTFRSWCSKKIVTKSPKGSTSPPTQTPLFSDVWSVDKSDDHGVVPFHPITDL